MIKFLIRLEEKFSISINFQKSSVEAKGSPDSN